MLHDLLSMRFVCALLATGSAATFAGTPRYALTDLGMFSPEGINANAQIGGTSNVGGGSVRASIYSGGIINNLGTLGGSGSRAHGINASGQVTGEATTTGDSYTHAFLYGSSGMRDLGTLPGYVVSVGLGLNNSGQVVGTCSKYYGDTHAFLFSNGVMRDLGTLGGGQSSACAINDSGQITGCSLNSDGLQRAYLYSGGVMQNLGTLGGSFSYGSSINASGQLTGRSSTTNNLTEHAFLYSNGVMRDLGSLGGTFSDGLGINASGQVVGWSYIAGDTAQHAMVYSEGTMQDLNNLIAPGSGWTLTKAKAINDNGWIVGYGVDAAGGNRTFLLRPVPEPATLCLGAGLIALLTSRRQRAQSVA